MIVRSIIFVNIAIFLLWFFLPDPAFMIDHFLVSWSYLESGKYWTLLTSVFSHNQLFHIMINLYAFYGFGRYLEKFMGPGKFLIFYLVAGVAGSLLHCYVSYYLLGEARLPALGASGAICGVILVFSLLFPREKVLLLGFIPVPAIWGAIILVGIDLWGLAYQAQGKGFPIGHGAHLGGALAGLICFLFLRSKLVRHP